VSKLRAEGLTAEAFSPYGQVVSLPHAEAFAAGPGWRWWPEIAALEGDGRAWGVGYLDLEPVEPRFDWAERHLRTQEGIFATSDDLLVYVGPPEQLEDPAALPRLERFRVFRVPAGSGVVLDRGVWHGAPLATGSKTFAVVLILEGTGTHDVTVVRFPDTPVDIELER
jgi:ureidoglycolate lyase